MRFPARLAALFVTAIATALPVHATTATLLITARVLPRATIQFHQGPDLQITADDVRRGYVDAEAPLAIGTPNTGQRGVQLLFTVQNPHVRHVRLDGLGASLHLRADGGSTLLRAGPHGNVPLQFRFYLAPDTPAGRYRWPVQVEASA